MGAAEAWLDRGVQRLLCHGRILRHAAFSRLSYIWWCASGTGCNRSPFERDFSLSEFMGLVQYRSMLSQVRPVPRAFGLPVVRIQSCLAVREHVFHHWIV